MKIIRRKAQIKKKYKRPYVAIGVFDGLHQGHQKIIQYTVKKAKQERGESIVITFWPHPVNVLRQDLKLPLIVSLPYRLRLIEELGINICIVIPFTKSFSKLSPGDFIKRYLVHKIQPKEVIVGDDFRFGQDRIGTIENFKKAGNHYGFKVHTFQTKSKGEKNLSSTRVRQLITQGRLKQAAKILNRPISILGRIVRGEGRGKCLGYPTANLIPDGLVLPPLGVYLVKVFIGKRQHLGIANVGCCPSLKKFAKVNIEVHIFNFRKDLYGKEILVEFIKKIRNEKKFRTTKDLVRQIKKDEQRARQLFASI